MARILLVDDNESIRDLVTLRLELAGHDVILALNGKEGVDTALRECPDLVLMDMHMPVMSGHDATAMLRKSRYTGVIIALTASALVSQNHRAIEAGCDRVITKPISVDFEDEIATVVDSL